MPYVTLHLERTIDASHVIPDHPGKCARMHGHTYRFQVWLSGPVAADGFLVDFFDVKREIDAWDHRHLNDVVAYVPTAELLCHDLQQRLLQLLRTRAGARDAGSCGVFVRLWETPHACAEAGWLTPAPDQPSGAVRP